MTEQEFMAAVDAAVARWAQDREGEPLTCRSFDTAVEAKCHDKAEAYAAQHGGEVVRGFVIQHPRNWLMVWVMPYSVVRTTQGLVDVTLKKAQLHDLAFFPVDGAAEGFVEWAKRHPRESRPFPSLMSH